MGKGAEVSPAQENLINQLTGVGQRTADRTNIPQLELSKAIELGLENLRRTRGGAFGRPEDVSSVQFAQSDPFAGEMMPGFFEALSRGPHGFAGSDDTSGPDPVARFADRTSRPPLAEPMGVDERMALQQAVASGEASPDRLPAHLQPRDFMGQRDTPPMNLDLLTAGGGTRTPPGGGKTSDDATTPGGAPLRTVGRPSGAPGPGMSLPPELLAAMEDGKPSGSLDPAVVASFLANKEEPVDIVPAQAGFRGQTTEPTAFLTSEFGQPENVNITPSAAGGAPPRAGGLPGGLPSASVPGPRAGGVPGGGSGLTSILGNPAFGGQQLAGGPRSMSSPSLGGFQLAGGGIPNFDGFDADWPGRRDDGPATVGDHRTIVDVRDQQQDGRGSLPPRDFSLEGREDEFLPGGGGPPRQEVAQASTSRGSQGLPTVGDIATQVPGAFSFDASTGMNPLMGRLENQIANAVNESSAARGAFGSSANQNQILEALAPLALQTQQQAFNEQLGGFGANMQRAGQLGGLQQQGFGQAQQLDQTNFNRALQQLNINEQLENVARAQQQQPLNYALQLLGLGQGGNELNQALGGLNQSIGVNAQAQASSPLAQLAQGLGGLGGIAATGGLKGAPGFGQ